MKPSHELVERIAADLATWAPHPAHVELAIFRTDDAREIAARLDELCTAALGAPIAGARFYGSSVGSVAGVVLADGREVVIKSPTATSPSQSASGCRARAAGRRRLTAGARRACDRAAVTR